MKDTECCDFGLVTVMRKLLFAILVFVLMLNLGLGRSKVISNVSVSDEIYQGDLILNGDNVTIIEGYFAINGSIHVEENATLILRNAIVNFTKSNSGFLLRYAANGNPTLQAENTEIVGNAYSHLYGNSSATFSNITGNAYFQFYDETSGSFVDSTFEGFQARQNSTVTASNSTLQYLDVAMFHGNASVANLSPGFFNHWDFQENCSVAFTSVTEAPQIVVNQTTVNSWGFSFQGNCTATITKCELYLHSNGWSVVDARDSMIDTVELYESVTATLTNITHTQLRLFGSAKVYVYWYLEVQVLDDSPTPGQSVESTNVTATFSNGTLAAQALTGVDGLARLTLVEKMANETGDYPVGTYAVNATYLSYYNGSVVNVTGNQAITLTLEGFVVPEFSSFLMLSLFTIATLVAVITHKRKR